MYINILLRRNVYIFFTAFKKDFTLFSFRLADCCTKPEPGDKDRLLWCKNRQFGRFKLIDLVRIGLSGDITPCSGL